MTMSWARVGQGSGKGRAGVRQESGRVGEESGRFPGLNLRFAVDLIIRHGHPS